jgi:hypothetical protein
MIPYLNPLAKVYRGPWEGLRHLFLAPELRVISKFGSVTPVSYLSISPALTGRSNPAAHTRDNASYYEWRNRVEEACGDDDEMFGRAYVSAVYSEVRNCLLERYLSPNQFSAEAGPMIVWKYLKLNCEQVVAQERNRLNHESPFGSIAHILEIDFSRKRRDRLAISTRLQAGGKV